MQIIMMTIFSLIIPVVSVTNVNTRRDRVTIWCEDWCTGHTHMVTIAHGTYTQGPTHSD